MVPVGVTMSSDLPIIHPGPWSESYRRSVLAQYGVDPYEAILGPLPPLAAPPLWTPTRSEVLTHLKADIAPTYIPALWANATPEERALPLGTGDQNGRDVWGTWHWLSFDDDLFDRAAKPYHEAGNRVIACSLVIGHEGSTYQGRAFDLTADVPLLRARLGRCYRYGLIPMICLQLVDADGHGAESVAKLRVLLPQIADLVSAALLGWETRVDGGPSGYGPDDLAAAVRVFRQHCPEGVLGVEFATPEGHEPITHDGRTGLDAVGWWRGPGQPIDVLMLEVGYHQADDERAFVDDVAGAVCRFQWPFPVRDTWPDGSPVAPETLNNWRGPDYGVHKVVMLFEYAAYLRWSTAKKRARRELVQWMVPTLSAWGEG